jgi:hypothetical protein
MLICFRRPEGRPIPSERIAMNPELRRRADEVVSRLTHLRDSL